MRAPSPARGPLERRLLGQGAVRRTVAASVALGLLASGSIVVQALALSRLLAGAMGEARLDPLPDVAWLAGAVALRGLCAVASELVAARGSEAAKAVLRARLLGAALRPGGGPPTAGPAEVATLAGRGLDALDPYIGRCLPDLVLAATVPIALATVIGSLDWVSGIVVAVVLVLFPTFGLLVGESSTRLATARWAQVEAFGRQIADVFEGLPTLRALGRSAQQRARIAGAGEALRQASLSTLRVALLSALVLDTLASVSVAMVAVPLGLRLLDGSIHLSAALAVLVIAPEVFLPLRRASAEFHESTEGLAAARHAMDLIQAGTSDRPRSGGGPSPGATARTTGIPDPARVPVTLHRVRAAPPGRDRPVLDGASLRIRPGETVVVVGANGAGKTTTLSLLIGFLLPTEGAVRVGDADLRELDPGLWRRRLSYLPERPALLAASLADNLRLADPAAGDARLCELLEAVGGADLLARLPDGLATRLGEGGRAVSAGERQRIALARALLRPAYLYLLDEPTVHLDEATEARVVEALCRHLEGRSAVIVSHRPAVAGLADRVVTLEAGSFTAAGALPPPVRRSPLGVPA